MSKQNGPNLFISAETSVSVGDRIGWGVIVPVSEQNKHEDRLIICYLCINLKVAMTRVIYQPRGGVYPVIMLPSGGKSSECVNSESNIHGLECKMINHDYNLSYILCIVLTCE